MRVGAAYSFSRKRAAATRSLTSEEKVVREKSPSLSPRPVKSKRSTAMRMLLMARVMFTAALRFLEQVKQWANTA